LIYRACHIKSEKPPKWENGTLRKRGKASHHIVTITVTVDTNHCPNLICRKFARSFDTAKPMALVGNQ
jgi:hypothetical protein